MKWIIKYHQHGWLPTTVSVPQDSKFMKNFLETLVSCDAQPLSSDSGVLQGNQSHGFHSWDMGRTSQEESQLKVLNSLDSCLCSEFALSSILIFLPVQRHLCLFVHFCASGTELNSLYSSVHGTTLSMIHTKPSLIYLFPILLIPHSCSTSVWFYCASIGTKIAFLLWVYVLLMKIMVLCFVIHLSNIYWVPTTCQALL